MNILFWGGVVLVVLAVYLLGTRPGKRLILMIMGMAGVAALVWPMLIAHMAFMPAPHSSRLLQSYSMPGEMFSLKGPVILGSFSPFSIPKPGFYEQIVYFATDRDDRGEKMPPAMRFGNQVSSSYADVIYGTAVVTIPETHEIGALESPFRLWRIKLPENPKKHVILESVQTFPSPADFYANMQEKLRDASRSYALIFIHGYNVTFEDAARRTAQMAFDLRFQGPAVFYSWPSAGETKAYSRDEETIRISQASISSFLTDFADSSDAEEIFVIGHSMGTRALMEAYAQLFAKRPDLKSRFKEIILAAPDINQSIFRQQIMPAMQSHGVPVTLYASSKDRALLASEFVHDYPRLGDTKPKIVLAPGMDSIDASMVDTEFLGHSYYAQSILSDIHGIIENNLSAEKRFGLKRIETEEGVYWQIAPGF